MADLAATAIVNGSYADGTSVDRVGAVVTNAQLLVEYYKGRGALTENLGGGVSAIYYKMRAQDSGASLPGYVSWAGNTPDFAGAGYAGGVPVPVGAMTPDSVAVVAVRG